MFSKINKIKKKYEVIFICLHTPVFLIKSGTIKFTPCIACIKHIREELNRR